MKLPHDFAPKKSLGQHFLADENVARKIVRTIDPQPADVIVEVGPGFGGLTQYLVESGCRLIAIEIDQRLIPDLQKRFGNSQRFTLIHADFRKVDLAQLAGNAKIRVIGNIPYHITSSLIFTAFAQRQSMRDMILTIQKEVAERVVAKPGGKDYGILAIVSQTFAQTNLLFTISKHVFRPKPEIDSAVVRWQFQPPPIPILNEHFYLELVKAAFSQRRKTLRRSLSKYLDAVAGPTPAAIDLQRRPETLSIAEMITLANSLTPATP